MPSLAISLSIDATHPTDADALPDGALVDNDGTGLADNDGTILTDN